jgi:hypothetical protein
LPLFMMSMVLKASKGCCESVVVLNIGAGVVGLTYGCGGAC